MKRQSFFECSEQCELIRVQHGQGVVLKIGADADQLRDQLFEFHGQHADQIRIGRILLLGLPKFLLLGSSFLSHWLRGFADLSMNFPQSRKLKLGQTEIADQGFGASVRIDGVLSGYRPQAQQSRARNGRYSSHVFPLFVVWIFVFLFYEYPGRSVVIGNPVLSGKLRPSRMYREIEHERGMVPTRASD